LGSDEKDAESDAQKAKGVAQLIEARDNIEPPDGADGRGARMVMPRLLDG